MRALPPVVVFFMGLFDLYVFFINFCSDMLVASLLCIVLECLFGGDSCTAGWNLESIALCIGARVSEHERVGAIAVFFARVAQLRDSGR